MSEEQPSWIVEEEPEVATSSRDLVLGASEEAELGRKLRAEEAEADAQGPIPYRIVGLSLLLGMSAAALGTFIATANPITEDASVEAAAAEVLHEQEREVQGVQVRKGMRNGALDPAPQAAPPQDDVPTAANTK